MSAEDVTRTPVPPTVTTPSSVEAGIGALEFTDGYPTVRRQRSCATTWTTCTVSRRS